MKKRKSLLFAFLILGGAISTNQVWALEQVGGVYQIGTAQDWADFCDLHNGTIGQTLNAVLTADVTVSGNTMIGKDVDGYPFRGTFDGQGHTLTIAYVCGNDEGNHIAPFRRINGATIKNLRVDGTITVNDNKQFAGGIVGGIWGSSGDSRILNCVSNVTITDNGSHDGTHGGIVGYCKEGSYSLIERCAFTGGFNASNVDGCGGIIGWSQNDMFIKDCYVSASINVKSGDIIDRNVSVTYNCYYVNAGSMGNKKSAIQVTSSEVSSGELCFKLNNRECYSSVAWHQTIGTDNYPLPFGSSIVYPYSDQGVQCNGWGKNSSSTTFRNTKDCTIDEHDYDGWGFCQTKYGDTQCSHQKPDFITPVDNYYEISSIEQLNWFVEKVNKGDVFINAKLNSDINYGNRELIGKEVNYGGVFDGQQHTITIDFTSGKDYGNVALFRNICSATIKNLKVAGAITNNSHQVGGLVSTSRRKSTIKNVIVAVNITSTHEGDGTHGGVIAVAHDVPTIENVGFVGSINASKDYGTCGIIGYAHTGGSIHYKNCYVSGTLNLTGTNNRVFGRNGEYCDNCYTTSDMTKLNNEERFIGEKVTSTQVSNGCLAYKLNGDQSDKKFYQTIGTDDYPLPFNSHKVVYEHSDVYTNIQSKIGDYYQIGNADDLESFAGAVKIGLNTLKAQFTADIDMTGHGSFHGIGTGERRFKGEIDGQKHKITNWTVDADEKVGLVRIGGDGLTMKDITIDNTCSIKGTGCTAAFVSDMNGDAGEVTLQNLGNEAAVNGGKNASGILGCNYNGGLIVVMKNCYNTGAITATDGGNPEGGALSGWLGSDAKVYNCYNTGTITGGAGLCRGNGSYTNENTFTTSTSISGDNCWTATNSLSETSSSAKDFENGKIFAALHDYTNADPAVDGSVWQMEFSGTAHPVLYDAALVLKEDFPNRPKDGRTGDLKLYRTTVAGTWNTFCVPFNMDASQIATVFGTGAKLTELDTESSDSETLHFKTAYTITAGKAYLVKPATAITSGNYATVSGVTVSADDPTVSENSAAGFSFQGVYSPTTLTTSDHVLTASNTIKTATDATVMNGFRAYLHKTSAGARATHFVIDDEEGGQTTGIITPEGEVIIDEPVYNLNGQRVNQTAHGLMIKGGKKYVKM